MKLRRRTQAKLLAYAPIACQIHVAHDSASVALMPESADLADAVAVMNADIGLPAGLSTMGVEEEDIPELIAFAQKDLSARTNPREASANDFEMMIRQSL